MAFSLRRARPIGFFRDRYWNWYIYIFFNLAQSGRCGNSNRRPPGRQRRRPQASRRPEPRVQENCHWCESTVFFSRIELTTFHFSKNGFFSFEIFFLIAKSLLIDMLKNWSFFPSLLLSIFVSINIFKFDLHLKNRHEHNLNGSLFKICNWFFLIW